MKRLLYVCTALVLVASFGFVGGKTYAARPSAVTVVRLCSSAPVGVPGDAHLVQGIYHGVELATTQWRPKFRKMGITVLAPLELNDAKADGSAVDAAKEASNARQCLDTASAMGYIGTLNSSMAQVSEPILNQGGMAMISPSNSNPVLTNPAQRRTYEPATWSHKLKYLTYYRMVTTDSLQGPAGAIFMKNNLGVKKYFLVDDGQTYGVGLAQHMDAYARSKLGMSSVGSGRINTSSASAISSSAAAVARSIVAAKPDAVYCGCDEPNSYPLEKAARRDGFTGPYVGGDAIYDSSWFKFVGTARANNTIATFIGLGTQFTSAKFRRAYARQFPGFVIGPYDALSYDASNVALRAIYLSAKSGALNRARTPFARRASILPYIANVQWHGANGLETFDHNGDTTLKILTVFRAQNGSWNYAQTLHPPAYLKPTP